MRIQDGKDEIHWRDWLLENDGLLDPDQPTESSTIAHRQRMTAVFSPTERALIRSMLGMETP